MNKDMEYIKCASQMWSLRELNFFLQSTVVVVVKIDLSWLVVGNLPSNAMIIRVCFTEKSSYRRCSIKKLFLKISQYSQENTCFGVSFL